jgi:hypothetical protein
MTSTNRSRRLVRFLLAVAVPSAGAAGTPGTAVPPRIAETQVTLRLGPLQGRGTVIAVAGPILTILTSAHFLGRADIGKSILVERPEGALEGHLGAITPNPDFPRSRSGKPYETPAREAVGVDTAIASIAIDLQGGAAQRVFGAIRPAELAPRPVPGSPGQVLTVHIVDQDGREHVVRAGNHLNPKCLAWGRRNYDTRRGDSGAGVFLVRTTPEGQAWPVLIGSVSQVDERGGIASLAHRNLPWIARAIGHGP